MNIIGIDHVQLAMPADREEDARAFYSGLLGITERPKPPDMAGRGGAWFENGRVKIHLGVEVEFRAARKAHPGLLVADLRDLVRVLTEAGCEVRVDNAIEGCDRAFVNDPFGNRIELIQAG